jgi:hypothetical protein
MEPELLVCCLQYVTLPQGSSKPYKAMMVLPVNSTSPEALAGECTSDCTMCCGAGHSNHPSTFKGVQLSAASVAAFRCKHSAMASPKHMHSNSSPFACSSALDQVFYQSAGYLGISSHLSRLHPPQLQTTRSRGPACLVCCWCSPAAGTAAGCQQRMLTTCCG